MTKEYDKAAMIVGAFLRWFEMAIKEMTNMTETSNLKFWDRRKANAHIRKMKKMHSKSDRDFKALLEALAKLDGQDGHEERANDVYRLVRRTLVDAQIQYKDLAKLFNQMRFTRGK